MERFKQICLRLLFLPPALVVLLALASIVLMVYAFAWENPLEPVVYGSYALSAYALTVACVRGPAFVRWVRRFKADNRFLRRYSADPVWRVKLSLAASLTSNGLYAAFQLFLGIWHRSIWYCALASYYALLLFMRISLARQIARTQAGTDLVSEFHQYRRCGVVLTAMNAALSVIVFYIVYQERGFSHHPITTIAMATYTFYSLAIGAVNVVRYRRYRSPLLSAAKAVNLASALVSMLSLETAMISAFGTQKDHVFRQIMTGTSGGAVCILILAMGIGMIVNATRQIGRQTQGVDRYER